MNLPAPSFRLFRLLALGVGFLPVIGSAVSFKIAWDDPEDFSDMEEDGYYSARLLDQFETAVREVLEAEVPDAIPADGRLELTFHDVDLAGEFEPWRTALMDVRIMRDIYPPRLKFAYRVLDANDKVLAQGMAQLTDLTYLWNVPPRSWSTHEKFYYERELIEDWVARKLPTLLENGEGTDSEAEAGASE